MTNFLALNIQSTLELIVFALVSKWYIAPKLLTKNLYDALIPFYLFHALRFLPITLIGKGTGSPEIPQLCFPTKLAYGAWFRLYLLYSIFFLKFRISGAIATAWIFNILGAVDLINASESGLEQKLLRLPALV